MSSLGEKLRQARESRGVTISELAEQTRISAHYLEAIDSDDYRTLPGGIFNKGFVKAYAKYVGVDEQEALQEYGQIIAAQGDRMGEQEIRSHRPEVLTDGGPRGSMLPTLIFAAVILGLVTWGIIALVDMYNKSQQPAQANAATPANTTNTNGAAVGTTSTTLSNTGTNAASANTNTAQPSAPPAAPGEMNIQIKTTAEVAIRTNTDGKIEDVTQTPDMTRNLAPLQKAVIRYYRGHFDKVVMTINGKAITLPSAPRDGKGKGIEFEISKENIGQILQSGAITFDLPAANTAAPAAAAAPAANAAPPAR